MAVYTVHKRPGERADAVHLVPEGFSLAAAAFTALWALVKGQWLLALMFVAISAALTMVGMGLGLHPVWELASQTLLALGFGAAAHDLTRWMLRLRGFSEIATVTGGSEEMAELSYFSTMTHDNAAPPPAAAQPYRPSDMLGLFGNV
jgi:hypothetical protein